jgi:hypothetical protein
MVNKNKKYTAEYETLLLENVLMGDEPEASVSAAILNRLNDKGDDNEKTL